MKSILPHHSIILLNKTKLPGVSTDGVICVILCCSALEAFLHELAAWYAFINDAKLSINGYRRSGVVKTKDGWIKIQQSEIDLLHLIEQLEKNNVCISEKYREINKYLGKSIRAKGEQPFQNFSDLINIRNKVVHLKTVPLKLDHSESFIAPESIPKVLRNLGQQKVVDLSSSKVSWIDSLNSEGFIVWCRKACGEIIADILDSLPNEDASKTFRLEYCDSLKHGKG